MNKIRGALVVGMMLAGVGWLTAQEQSFTSPYFPLKVGHKWHYRIGEHEVTVECEQTDVYKTKKKNAKGEDEAVALTTYRLKSSSNKVTLLETVGVMGDGIYRFSAAGKPINPPLKLLPLPVDVNQKWEVKSVSEKADITGTFLSQAAEIKVPAGMYLTRTASSLDFRVGPQKMEVEYWFAENVGIVRQRTKIGDGKDIVLELIKFNPGK